MDSFVEQLLADPWGRLLLRYVAANGISDWLAVLLVGGRLIGLFFVAPQIMRCSFPYSIRIGLVVVLTLVVAPVVASTNALHGEIVQLAYQASSKLTTSQVAIDLGGSIAGEIALGTLLGACVLTLFSGLKMAGTWLERHSGLGQGSVVNPDWFAGESASGSLVVLLGIVSLLLFDPVEGHWPVLRAFLRSFQEIPIGTAVESLPLHRLLSTVVQQSMVLGFRLAMPLLVTMSFIDATFAFANRTGPQLSISNFVSVRLIVGMVALALTMTTVPDVISSVWSVLGELW